jgi:hypothetical protein
MVAGSAVVVTVSETVITPSLPDPDPDAVPAGFAPPPAALGDGAGVGLAPPLIGTTEYVALLARAPSQLAASGTLKTVFTDPAMMAMESIGENRILLDTRRHKSYLEE